MATPNVSQMTRVGVKMSVCENRILSEPSLQGPEWYGRDSNENGVKNSHFIVIHFHHLLCHTKPKITRKMRSKKSLDNPLVPNINTVIFQKYVITLISTQLLMYLFSTNQHIG